MMAKLKNLEKFKEMVYTCLRCGSCRDLWDPKENVFGTCPIREHTGGFDVYFMRGKLMLARKALEGVIEPNPDMARYIYLCSTCGNCEAHCRISQTSPGKVDREKTKLDQIRVIEAFRADLVDLGLAHPRHKAFADSIAKNHNPYGEPHEARLAWMPEGFEMPKGDPEMIYFVGCTSAYRRTELARATVDVLRKAGVAFRIMHPDEWCCGSPLLRTGQRGLAEEVARHNLDAIRGSGIKTVVTSCAGCYRALRVDYREMFGDLGFEVKHISEVVNGLLEEGRLKLKRPLAIKATYHDPCHLGRHCDYYEPPRALMAKLKGIEFVEMPRTRSGAWCCGSGGGVKSAFGDLATEIATDRLKEAKGVGAEYLLSCCPFCKHNFLDAKRAMGSDLEIYDLIELVSQAT